MSAFTKLASLQFSGEKIDYPSYRQEVISLAAAHGVTDPNGFGQLGHLLPDAEYLALTFPTSIVPASFVRLVDPGPRAVLPTAPAAVAGAATVFAMWKYDKDQFQLQESTYGEFKAAFLLSLDSNSRDAIMDPRVGASNRSVKQILAYMDKTWGTPSPSELRTVQSTLTLPYSDHSGLLAFIESHRKVHSFLDLHENKISDLMQVGYLIDAVSPCGAYSSAIAIWSATLGTSKAQTFESLADALVLFEGNRDGRATAASHGYAAAANSVKGVPSDIEQAVANALTKYLPTLVASAATMQPPTPTPSAPPPKHYCWTHGPGTHTSQECLHPASNHDRRATMGNQLGGRADRKKRYIR
jgi:hypothetical protein